MRRIERLLERAERHNNSSMEKVKFYESVREVEKMMEEWQKEYNSPEAKAKREEEYKELQRIGELRRAAYHRGESMDQYPLPWENEADEDEEECNRIMQEVEDQLRREGIII